MKNNQLKLKSISLVCLIKIKQKYQKENTFPVVPERSAAPAARLRLDRERNTSLVANSWRRAACFSLWAQ